MTAAVKLLKITAFSWLVLLLLLLINIKTSGLINFYFGNLLYYLFGFWPIGLILYYNRAKLANKCKEINLFLSNRLEEESGLNNKKIIFLTLTIILIAGLALRIFAAHKIGLSADSFLHMESAKSILAGEGNFYNRAALYTYFIAGSYFIFGATDAATHIPNLLLAGATILFSYYAGRKMFGSGIAILSATLMAFSFWHIGETANVRMYIFFSLTSFIFFYTAWRFLFTPKIFKPDARPIEKVALLKLPYLGIIAFWLLISLSLQALTVILVPPFFIFFVLLAGYYIWTDFHQGVTSVRADNALKIVLLMAVASGIALVFMPEILGQFWSNLKWNNEAAHNFKLLGESLRNGYGWLLGLYGQWLFFLSLSVFFIFAIIKKHIGYLFWLFMFVGVWLESVFLIDRYFSPRYIIFLLPIFAPILSASIYWLVSIPIKKTLWRTGISLAIILVITPWPKIGEIIKNKTGENAIFGINYDFKGAINSLLISQNDALIQTFFGPFEFYQNTSKNIFNIGRLSHDGAGTEIPAEEAEKIFLKTVDKYSHGYFLTDFYRFEKWPCENYVPCGIYDHIEANPDKWRQRSYRDDPQIIIYEWRN